MEPECIIFDESTAMLDPQGRKEVMNTIAKLNSEQGITVIHITHNMDEAIKADRVIVINEGEVFLDGTPKEVFSNVGKLRLAGLDVPQVTELFYDLSHQGIDLPSDILYEEEGAEILSAMMKK
jgi:energy-coupling factor transport system ATP-binding protein